MLKVLLAQLFALVAFSAAAQASGELRLYGASGDGKAVEYAISEKRAEKLPRWESSQQALPLSVADAVARAQVWMKEQNPTIESFSPNRIELKHVSASRLRGLWYYSVGFDAIVNGNTMYSWSFEAVVLMDGSIVVPRVSKP